MEDGRAAARTGRVPTARVRLARLARDAALGVPGVVSVGPRPAASRATLADGERLEGVVAAAEPGGGYGVSLYLGVEPVPLRELGERVREAVAAAADRHGLVRELGPVDVVIDDLVEPGAPTAAGARGVETRSARSSSPETAIPRGTGQ